MSKGRAKSRENTPLPLNPANSEQPEKKKKSSLAASKGKIGKAFVIITLINAILLMIHTVVLEDGAYVFSLGLTKFSSDATYRNKISTFNQTLMALMLFIVQLLGIMFGLASGKSSKKGLYITNIIFTVISIAITVIGCLFDPSPILSDTLIIGYVLLKVSGLLYIASLILQCMRLAVLKK